jgi:hypothetical protein
MINKLSDGSEGNDIYYRKAKKAVKSVFKRFFIHSKTETTTQATQAGETQTETVQEVKTVEQLRAEEQAEYDAMPDPNDQNKRKEIYDRYDKLITPLLEQEKEGSVGVGGDVERSVDIKAQKADIERRKQDALKSIKQNGNRWEATIFSETGFETEISQVGGTREDVLKDIEKRFEEEELKAAEQSLKETIKAETTPTTSNQSEIDKKADIERKKRVGDMVIDYVWKRLANQGITNADPIIGTRDTIDNVDFDKFWSNVLPEDLQNLIKFFEEQKKQQLQSFEKYQGAFDPTTGTFTSDDTSFYDNKIADVDAELKAVEQSLKETQQTETKTEATPETVQEVAGKTELEKESELPTKVTEKAKKQGLMTSNGEVNSYMVKKLQKVEPITARQAILKAFVGGTKILRSDFNRETGFGAKSGLDGKVRGKEEAINKNSITSNDANSKNTLTVAGLTMQIMESLSDSSIPFDEQQIRAEIIDVLSQFNTKYEIASELFEDFSSEGVLFETMEEKLEASAIAYYSDRSNFEPEFTKEEIAAFEQEEEFNQHINNLSDAEIEQIYGRYEPTGKTTKPTEGGEGKTVAPKTEVTKEPAQVKKLADKLRSLKIDTKGKAFDATLGIPISLYNSAIDIVVASVEAGMKLSNAIAKAMKYVDSQMDGANWNKGKFAKDMNVRYSVTLSNGDNVDVERDTSDEAAEVINGWYQPIEQKILDTKQDKQPANKWGEQLRSKEDEDLWTGVRAFLEEKGTESVSKKELLDFIKENRVEIVEVVKGEDFVQKENEYKSNAKKRGKEAGLNISFGSELDIEISIPTEGFLNADEVSTPSKREFAAKNYEIDIESLEVADELFKENKKYASKSNPFYNQNNDVKFSQYQLEGEKSNYKEVLVMMPETQGREVETMYDDFGNPTTNTAFKPNAVKSKGTFKSSHFDEPNILVHLRMNTRTDAEGNKVLFLEEVQSDWGQQGKKEGFKGKDKISEYDKVLKELLDQYNVATENELNEVISRGDSNRLDRASTSVAEFDTNVPTAPFVTDTNTWVKLGLKVALKEAVKQGADKIAWTTGEQQNDRYDLSKTVDYIQHEDGFGGTKYVDIGTPNGLITFQVDKQGKILENKNQQVPESIGKNLADVIGKDITDRILIAKKGGRFEGEGLKVGGKGMKGFYGSPGKSVKYTEPVFVEGEGWAVKTFPHKNNPLGGVGMRTYPTKELAQIEADKQSKIIAKNIGSEGNLRVKAGKQNKVLL